MPTAPTVSSSDFSEKSAWSPVPGGWRPLFGRVAESGFSLEWHEFDLFGPLPWDPSFHPGAIEVCLNLEGCADLSADGSGCVLNPLCQSIYHHGQPGLSARRLPGGRHRFLTVEFSREFLRTHLASGLNHLHPDVRSVLDGRQESSFVLPPEPLPSALFPLIESLRHCPAFQPAQPTWFLCKALEVAALLLFKPSGDELFCTRAQRAARERVEKARSILVERLAQPPSLEELARTVGCSSFYLSRQFSAETGLTLPQFLRRIRLEKAAELIRSGRCNVTEAAMEVGYNSLSHFSTAFHEMFGCCPGLYPQRFNPVIRPAASAGNTPAVPPGRTAGPRTTTPRPRP